MASNEYSERWRTPCGHTDAKVIDSRIAADGHRRRRYLCTCGYRWSTVELPTQYTTKSPGTGVAHLREEWCLTPAQLKALAAMLDVFGVSNSQP